MNEFDVTENFFLRRENERLRDMIATMGKAMEEVIKITASVFHDGPRQMTTYGISYAMSHRDKALVRSKDALCQMVIDTMARSIRDDFDGAEKAS